MTYSGIKDKINYKKVAPLLALMFAVGFGIPTALYVIIFCDDCIPIPDFFEEPAIDPCLDDPRCIEPPPEVDETKNFTNIGKYKVAFLQELYFLR